MSLIGKSAPIPFARHFSEGDFVEIKNCDKPAEDNTGCSGGALIYDAKHNLKAFISDWHIKKKYGEDYFVGDYFQIVSGATYQGVISIPKSEFEPIKYNK